jgi:hypothetical protein
VAISGNTSPSTSVLFLSLAVLALPLNDDNFCDRFGFEVTGYNAALSNLRPFAPEALTDAKQVESITIFNSKCPFTGIAVLQLGGRLKFRGLDELTEKKRQSLA